MDYEKKYNEALRLAKSYYGSETNEFLDAIFPELKESEDEMTRKELIEYLTHRAEVTPFIDEDKDCKRWIAYLEKQKEQQFTHHEVDESLQSAVTHQMEDDGDVDDFVRKGLDEIVLKYAALGARWQKEQKPDLELIKQSWYMEGYTDGKFKREPMWNLKTGEGGPRYEENEKYGQMLEQKPAECIEDDELLLNAAIYMVEKGNIIFAFENNKCKVSDWLKLLPGRFGLQPKQEWGEEEEKDIQEASDYLRDYANNCVQ